MGWTGISVIWLCVCCVVQTSFVQLSGMQTGSFEGVESIRMVQCNGVGVDVDAVWIRESTEADKLVTAGKNKDNDLVCTTSSAFAACSMQMDSKENVSVRVILTDFRPGEDRSYTCVIRLKTSTIDYEDTPFNITVSRPDCTDNTHGINCRQRCGQCKGGQTCNPQTGECNAGCGPGFKSSDVLCKTTCTDNTYGINCSQRCGQCKGGQTCNPQTGECTAGCGPGFKSSDVLCKTKCDNGMRGENCSIRCGQCQYVTSCHHVTGECGESGCVPGYSGALCLQLENNKDNDSLAGPIVGAILGAGLMMAISVFAAIRWRRKSNGSARKDTTVEMASVPANNPTDSAITGPHLPPPSSSTPGVEGSIYEIVDNDNDTLPTAPRPSSSAAGDEGRHYEN